MYEALAKPLQAKAVHLRSAATFKPTAARMLGELLDDMRAALDADGAAYRGAFERYLGQTNGGGIGSMSHAVHA